MSRTMLEMVLEERRRQGAVYVPPEGSKEILFGYYFETPSGDIIRGVSSQGTYAGRVLSLTENGYCTPSVEGRKYSYRCRRRRR